MTSLDIINRRVEALKQKYAERDRWAAQIRHVREGKWDQIAPGTFSDEWPGPTVANMIEVMARDFAASASGMPAINCSSANMSTDAAKERAAIRTKVANHYVTFSRLAAHLPDGADNYQSYGMLALLVTPDMKAQTPRIQVMDSQNVYPIWDETGCTISVARSYILSRIELEARYPQVKEAVTNGDMGGLTDYEVITYNDASTFVSYIPRLSNLVLHETPNPLGYCFWVCIPRPSGAGTWDGHFRGAYNDLIWPQMARHNFQMLAMSAADQAVNAAVAVPMDVLDMPYGPNAIIKTNNPQGVHRVSLDVPQGVWQALGELKEDMTLGGMTSNGRLGQAGSGWTTGQGLDHLGEGYSSQVALAQMQFGFGIQQAIELCFAWDEALWGEQSKKIRAMDPGGAPYQLTYRPARDIDGDHTVDVSYGFLQGLDANRALIFLLQASAGGYISRDYAMRQMPQGIDARQEAAKIQAEKLTDGLVAALSALPQAIPQMVTQGQDPSQIIAQYGQALAAVKNGDSLEDAIAKAFAPQPPPAAQAPDAGQPSPAPGEAAPGGVPAPLDTGGRPPLSMLAAGLTARGNPNLSGIVSHQQAAVA